MQQRDKNSNQKKNNIISIQKYYKASKIMKFTDRNGLEDDGKYFKNKSQQTPSSNQGLRNKTNESLKGHKYSDSQRKDEPQSKASTRSYAKSHNQYYMRAELLNKAVK